MSEPAESSQPCGSDPITDAAMWQTLTRLEGKIGRLEARVEQLTKELTELKGKL